ncbi:hypothetical protein HDG33_006027 [Paraburkholderia sp. Cpub6]|nr:hypothetical protein [Paraburkholderia sp. Cpub6]
MKMGHEVKLMPAEFAKAFNIRNKSDAADARAIWLAVQQPSKSVAVKSEVQQAMMGLHRMREQLVKFRTMQINGLRGLLTEYGEVMSRGRAKLDREIPAVLERVAERLPAVPIDTLRDQWNEVAKLDKQIAEIERRIRKWKKALTPLWRLQLSAGERRFGHYLLVRRSRDESREHAYYVVYAPRSKVTRQTLVNVAGRRWEIEVGFEVAKGECGLDQYEVRRLQGWYQHITLALPAHAVLAALRAQAKKKTTEGSLPFSVQEIRRLLCRLIWRTLHSIEHVMSWSIWRRRHQYRAQQCHYRRRGGVPPAYLPL